MTQGVYITANDRFLEYAIAFLESLRAVEPDLPVILIPYDENSGKVGQVLGDRFGVQIYPDLGVIDQLAQRLHEIFGAGFFARSNQFRKQACWFGPFDRFLYLDIDLIVLQNLKPFFEALETTDFICCDYQHAGGITNVFSPAILDRGVIAPEEVQSIFNGGLWGSKKGRITLEDLENCFQECAAHPEYFDFSQKTSDQPIINYLVLTRIPQRRNLATWPQKGAGSWAGSQHFVWENDRLMDPKVNQPVPYLHWAGIRIEPGCPYWDLWEHYRYLQESKPPISPLAPPPRSRFQRLKSWLKNKVKT
jgi:hypothetical protein